eukprot:364669-Chlamydomonas_euryale.AAC.11
MHCFPFTPPGYRCKVWHREGGGRTGSVDLVVLHTPPTPLTCLAHSTHLLCILHLPALRASLIRYVYCTCPHSVFHPPRLDRSAYSAHPLYKPHPSAFSFPPVSTHPLCIFHSASGGHQQAALCVHHKGSAAAVDIVPLRASARRIKQCVLGGGGRRCMSASSSEASDGNVAAAVGVVPLRSSVEECVCGWGEGTAAS